MKPLVAFDLGSQGCRFEPCQVQIKPVEILRTLNHTKKERAQERLLVQSFATFEANPL
jgi:hypothetical protein